MSDNWGFELASCKVSSKCCSSGKNFRTFLNPIIEITQQILSCVRIGGQIVEILLSVYAFIQYTQGIAEPYRCCLGHIWIYKTRLSKPHVKH